MNQEQIYTVHFPYLNKTIKVPSNATISEACFQVGVPLDLVCGGQGICGKCKVLIELDNTKKEILACKEKVSDDVRILIKNTEKRDLNILTEHRKFKEIVVNTKLRKKYIPIKKISMSKYSSDWEQIYSQSGLKINTPSIDILNKVSQIVHERRDGITLVVYEDRLIDIEEGDTSKEIYGIAIDMGTTSIAAYCYNLATGHKLGDFSALNKQSSQGADIISRIMTATDIRGQKEVQKLVIDTINELIEKTSEELNISPQSIYMLTICGNSAMHHLFLGLSVKHLGRAPFTPVTVSDISLEAEELNIKIHPKGIIYALPLIGGFVGSDTVAAILASRMAKDEEIKLLIDLGTNGEVVIGNSKKMLAASVAAGPALEGGGIKFGMRAIDGAIQNINLTREGVLLNVIGSKKPMGICGSGIIALLSEMRRMKLLECDGKLLSRVEYTTLYGENLLASRLDSIGGERVFIIAYESENEENGRIYITQKEIRLVQLAKGAIVAAYTILLKAYGIEGEKLNEIIIAGAMGNFIDIKQGQSIGLLPKFNNVSINSIGNAAGAGAQLVLLSEDEKKDALSLTKKIEHVELALDKDFQSIFTKVLNFNDSLGQSL